MSIRPTARAVCLTLGLAGAALGLATQSANAVPVSLNTWYEFGFGGSGSALSSGVGTVPATNAPDGNPIVQVGDAPWTISLAGPAQLTVLDLFLSVDQFAISDNAAPLGQTSVPTNGGTCDSDISCSLADFRYSRGIFFLGAGNHSLTGTQLAGQSGAAVFEITSGVTAVPEPASLSLVGAALAGLGLLRRRRRA